MENKASKYSYAWKVRFPLLECIGTIIVVSTCLIQYLFSSFSMSHCAPKQLASCLPKVVPKLTDAFSDTHPKVKKSAEEALEEICKVIKNPEIAEISGSLLKALTDASATLHALEALISTEFVHAIDAPSLSIIIPVVHRGLRDRAATTKRYAALISGNICTMVNDARDFVPYLPILLPDLKSTLLDPIPGEFADTRPSCPLFFVVSLTNNIALLQPYYLNRCS